MLELIGMRNLIREDEKSGVKGKGKEENDTRQEEKRGDPGVVSHTLDTDPSSIQIEVYANEGLRTAKSR